MLTITLNGEPHRFDKALSVAGMVEALGYAGKRIAVERNGEILPKSLHPATPLCDGDHFEIVVAVGGG